MRDNVLWRKKSVIIMMLAKELRVAPERALDLFYSTDVCRQLSDPRTGLQLMSDGYVLEDALSEIRTKVSPNTHRSRIKKVRSSGTDGRDLLK